MCATQNKKKLAVQCDITDYQKSQSKTWNGDPKRRSALLWLKFPKKRSRIIVCFCRIISFLVKKFESSIVYLTTRCRKAINRPSHKNPRSPPTVLLKLRVLEPYALSGWNWKCELCHAHITAIFNHVVGKNIIELTKDESRTGTFQMNVVI